MTGKLQEQLRQSKPFRSPEEQLFLTMLRIMTGLLDELTNMLRTYDVTQPQYNVLRILRGAGPAGLACGDIGERMVSKGPDVTRVLDRMELRGLVLRNRSKEDRRIVVARLTDEGSRIVDALDEPVADFHRRMLGHLTQPEIASLTSLLERARHDEV